MRDPQRVFFLCLKAENMTESEYTPTVERLRDDYRRSRVWEAHNGGEIYWEEFERRLKEIQADAWDEGKEDAMRGLDIHGDTNAENPYREAPNE